MTPYQQGITAYAKGSPSTTNPYPPSENYFSNERKWFNGWYQARLDPRLYRIVPAKPLIRPSTTSCQDQVEALSAQQLIARAGSVNMLEGRTLRLNLFVQNDILKG